MMIRTKVNQLSPDGFTRFFFLTDFLKQLYEGTNKKVRILDIGGGSEYFEQKLKASGLDYELTIIDILERPTAVKATYVKGDATNMNFKDDSFDAVVSTDVMEHIPPERKQAFLDEALRVAKDVCIIGAPFMTPGVDAAERAVNNFNKKLFGVGQDWLEEHLELGKPTVGLFEKTLKEKNIPYFHLGTQNLTTWLLNTHINLIDAKLGLDDTQHVKINKFYNDNALSMNEFEGMTYRQFFVMFTNPLYEKKFDATRYATREKNAESFTKYVSMLMDLFAQRISYLGASVSGLEKDKAGLEEKLERTELLVKKMDEQIEFQNLQLKRADPYMRIINSKQLNAVKKLIGRSR